MAIASYVGNALDKDLNTFEDWLNRTNTISSDMGSNVISVGDNNTGNVAITGSLSTSSIIAVPELRGGTLSTPAQLLLSSNVYHEASDFEANTTNFVVSGNNFVISAQFTTTSGDAITYNTDEVNFNGEDVNYNSNTINYNTGAVIYNTSDVQFNVGDVTFAANNTIYNSPELNYNTDLINYNSGDINYTANNLVLDAVTTTANGDSLVYDVTEIIYNSANINFNTSDVFFDTSDFIIFDSPNTTMQGTQLTYNNDSVDFNSNTVTFGGGSLTISSNTNFSASSIRMNDLIVDGSLTVSNGASLIIDQINLIANTITATSLDIDVITANTISANTSDIDVMTANTISANTVTAVDFNSTSDKTLKDNINTINNSLDVVNQINPVSFTWKDTGKGSYGVIAQEIEALLPEIVSEKDGIKSVAYTQIIAFLVGAIQEQQKEIDEIKSRLD